MAGGTGVPQARGKNVPDWMINNPNYDPMVPSLSAMREYTNPTTGESYMGTGAGQYMLDPSLKGDFVNPNGPVSLMPQSNGPQGNLMGANMVGRGGTSMPQQNPNLFDNSSRPSSMNNFGAGKGGGGQPAMPSNLAGQPPQQGQYAPMAPQGQFNVNQASAGALQQALGTTQQAMQRPIDIGAYANPYENQVVQQSMRDVGSAAKMGLNQLDAQAGAAKAFGGSRHGIAQSETMKGFNQQAMDQAAQLRSQGFNTSLQAAMADRQARLGAASQLGGLGQQAFGVGQTIQGNQQQQGLLQQSIQQALIDAARQQYAGYTGAPQTALQAPLAALGVTPTPQTTTNSMQPGLFNYLQLGAGMVGGSK